MFSKLNLMIRLKFRCYVWFWPQSSKCEAAENISRAAVDVFLSWQSQILEISSLKKKTKKTSKHLKNSPPWWSECSSFHRACGLREKPERYRNRFSRRPEETRRVLCLLSSLHSRLWKRHECHFSGKFECSDISLYLIDRWLFISLCFFPSCPGQQVHTSHSTHPTLGGTAPQWNEFKSSFQQDALNDYGSLVLKLRHYCIGISYSASAFFKFRSPLSPCLQGQTEKWIIIVSLWSPILSIHQHWSLHLF